MKPRRITANLSLDLAHAAESLASRRRLRSLSEYIKTLIREDAMNQPAMALGTDWASLTFKEQDQLDAALLKAAEEGKPPLHIAAWSHQRIRMRKAA